MECVWRHGNRSPVLWNALGATSAVRRKIVPSRLVRQVNENELDKTSEQV